MSKTEAAEIINLASKTIPFLMITATFIVIAYACGHTVAPIADNVFESSRIKFNHFL